MKVKRRNPRRKTRRKAKKRRGGSNHGERKTRRRNGGAELDCWCSPDDGSVQAPIPQAQLPRVPQERPVIPDMPDDAAMKELQEEAAEKNIQPDTTADNSCNYDRDCSDDKPKCLNNSCVTLNEFKETKIREGESKRQERRKNAQRRLISAAATAAAEAAKNIQPPQEQPSAPTNPPPAHLIAAQKIEEDEAKQIAAEEAHNRREVERLRAEAAEAADLEAQLASNQKLMQQFRESTGEDAQSDTKEIAPAPLPYQEKIYTAKPLCKEVIIPAGTRYWVNQTNHDLKFSQPEGEGYEEKVSENDSVDYYYNINSRKTTWDPNDGTCDSPSALAIKERLSQPDAIQATKEPQTQGKHNDTCNWALELGSADEGRRYYYNTETRQTTYDPNDGTCAAAAPTQESQTGTHNEFCDWALDNEGKKYYYNRETRQTTYNPDDGTCAPTPQTGTHNEYCDWALDNEGKKYYYNTVTKESTYDPDDGTCAAAQERKEQAADVANPTDVVVEQSVNNKQIKCRTPAFLTDEEKRECGLTPDGTNETRAAEETKTGTPKNKTRKKKKRGNQRRRREAREKRNRANNAKYLEERKKREARERKKKTKKSFDKPQLVDISKMGGKKTRRRRRKKMRKTKRRKQHKRKRTRKYKR